ncbi:MAG TPA: translation elongation factor Ts [bacterium]|jgi:elongation factor Ts|nr:translation elongation factor Ts [bacterium]HNT66922.1 translation elongation factor Ts [bacterium]HOX85963.1 translation elongation factor Ts [bacterium]HPG45054.1 translation elongation factor Ts [bacterium]HPM97296.1 translation elongation factor Ts [bacterium]
MAISANDVKTLRERTGAGMMDCKHALQESNGDMEKAIDWLRKKGLQKVEKKAGRETREGIIQHYIHPGSRLGVLVEVNCETDFVARTDDFQIFTKDIAMHIAASKPIAVTREEIPTNVVDKEREIYFAQVKEQGKPDAIAAKIVDGKLDKFYQENCLLEQSFVKDPGKSVQDYLNEMIAKLGENMVIRRFVRFQLGD